MKQEMMISQIRGETRKFYILKPPWIPLFSILSKNILVYNLQ